MTLKVFLLLISKENIQYLRVIMQGLWKTQLGGYNAKNIKRKSASRKHLLKDKARFIRKNPYHKKDAKVILGKDVECLYDEIFESVKISRYKMRDKGYKEIMIVHRRVRASVRTWIVKKDWEAERTYIYGETSVAWLID